mgnify:CR=1 FL=1
MKDFCFEGKSIYTKFYAVPSEVSVLIPLISSNRTQSPLIITACMPRRWLAGLFFGFLYLSVLHIFLKYKSFFRGNSQCFAVNSQVDFNLIVMFY